MANQVQLVLQGIKVNLVVQGKQAHQAKLVSLDPVDNQGSQATRVQLDHKDLQVPPVNKVLQEIEEILVLRERKDNLEHQARQVRSGSKKDCNMEVFTYRV